MPKKTDSSLTFLNSMGYNVVKLPRAGIEPLLVMGNDGTRNQLLGPLSKVWTTSSPLPEIQGPNPTTVLQGMKTDALDVNFGLSVLAGALAAFGATVPSLNTAYHSASKVQFSYTGVTSSLVDVFAAGAWLAEGILATNNPAVQNWFLNPDSRTFLITEVLKSTSITVSASDEHGVSVGVDVPAIEGMVGANVKVSPSDSSNSTVTYIGSLPITFGFAVQEIRSDGGRWSIHSAAPGAPLAFAVGDDVGDAPDQPRGVVLRTAPGECRVDL